MDRSWSQTTITALTHLGVAIRCADARMASVYTSVTRRCVGGGVIVAESYFRSFALRGTQIDNMHELGACLV